MNADINTGSLQRCTESFKNPCWVMMTNENKCVGVLKSEPFNTLAERLQEAVISHFDIGDVKIKKLKELADEIHELIIYISTDIEEGYNEIIELTPAWEY